MQFKLGVAIKRYVKRYAYNFLCHSEAYIVEPSPCNRVLEKLQVAQLFSNFAALCGTKRFMTVLTDARHLSLTSAEST
jgi:hypothetical protein